MSLHRIRNKRLAAGIRFAVWCLWAVALLGLAALMVAEGRAL